jgi:hypothetical protein
MLTTTTAAAATSGDDSGGGGRRRWPMVAHVDRNLQRGHAQIFAHDEVAKEEDAIGLRLKLCACMGVLLDKKRGRKMPFFSNNKMRSFVLQKDFYFLKQIHPNFKTKNAQLIFV